MPIIGFWAVMFGVLLGLGCQRTPYDLTPPSAAALVVAPETATIAVGTVQTFRATGGAENRFLWNLACTTGRARFLDAVSPLSTEGAQVSVVGDAPGMCQLRLHGGGQLKDVRITVVA